MALNIKNKIWLGTFFLFLLLLLTGGVGIYFMVQVQNNSKNILRDNYETLSYGHTMQQSLLSYSSSFEKSVKAFEDVLHKQQITLQKKVKSRLQTHLPFISISLNKAILHEIMSEKLRDLFSRYSRLI